MTYDGGDFVVFDTHLNEWVTYVDSFDGEVGTASDRKNARVFVGVTWRDFFEGRLDDLGRYRCEDV